MPSWKPRKTRPLTVYLLLAALSVTLIVLSSSRPVATAKAFETTVLAPWLRAVRLAGRMALVFRQNRLLWEELGRLRYERDLLLEMGQENKRLREMVRFKERTQEKLIVAEVLGSSVRIDGKSMIIDKGKLDGVRRDMPVLAVEGLVGRVDEVFPQHAVVVVLTDNSCPVSARLSGARHRGIVEWDVFSGGALKLKGIPEQAAVNPGDIVVTAGLGGVFPEGIEIGRVERVRKDLNGITLDIVVRPSVSFDRLEEVFVLEHVSPSPAFARPSR